MRKILLVIHNDLDGIGNYIILNTILKNDKIDTIICSNPKECSEKVKDFIENEDVESYSNIIISDISVNEEVAKMLNDVNENTLVSVNLFDHHPTASFLQELYPNWCIVHTDKNNLECGTSLLYNWCKSKYRLLLDARSKYQKDSLDYVVSLIKSWDTWEWNRTNNFIARDFNNLFHILGVNRFTTKFIEKLSYYYNDSYYTNELELFDDTDRLLLDLDEGKKNMYFEKKQEEMICVFETIDNRKYHIGVVFGEQYISELGNYLCATYPNLDFVCIINGSKVSLRSVKDNINLTEIAKVYSGGGHPKSSGFTISNYRLLSNIDIIFTN